MKKHIYRMSKLFHRYINGTKGVISIMLALFMTPMLSIALILVESARYQSAVETLEELLDSAALSTLAGYDSYLEDRFGVLAVDQENDISSTFSTYLNKNISVEGNSVTLNSIDATGDFALNDTSVLKQQLLEYSEIIVPAQAVYDISDVQDWLSNLEKGFGGKLDKIEKTANVVSNSGQLASDFSGFVTDIKEITEKYNDLTEKEGAYNTAYTEFESAVLGLASKIQAAVQQNEQNEDSNTETENSDITPTDVYETSEVKNAIREAEAKRDVYRDATESYASALKDFGNEISSMMGTVETLSQDVNNIKSSLDKLDSDSSGDTSTLWIIEKVEIVGDLINDTIGRNYSDQLTSDSQLLINQQQTIRGFKGKNVTETTMQASIQHEYGPISITSYTNFSEFSVRLAQELLGTEYSEEDKQSFLDYLGAGMDLLDNILDLNLIYDPALNANVPSGSLYNASVKGEVYGEALAVSMNELLAAMYDIYTLVVSDDEENEESLADRSLFEKAWDAIRDTVISIWNFLCNIVKALARLLVAIGAFLAAIVAFIGDWIKGAAALGYNWTELYNTFLLTGYVTYTLPNRTNYSSGKSLTGYSFSKIFKDLAGGATSHRLSGSLKTWTDSGSVVVPHELFYGAEMEYITIGTQNEINNQAAAFFAIYLMRLLLDFEAVSTNEWVQMEEELGNAVSFGVAGTIFKYLMVMLEPLLDTVILVNGGSEYMIKENIYLEPVGIPIFLSDLAKVSGLSSSATGKITGSIQQYEQYQEKLATGSYSNNPLKKDGSFDMTYSETLMVLCFFTVDPDTLLARLQNLMQMEAAYYYRNKFDFQLNKTYTYIHSDVTGSLNPLFKIDKLGQNGPFKIVRSQYTGY